MTSGSHSKRSRKATEAPDRPKKYKQWTEESMLGALKAVSEGMGVNRAAEEFGIPKTTLKDRISGKVIHGTKSGRTPYLTLEEEDELVQFIVSSAKMGYPKKREEVMGIVRKTLEAKGNGPVKFNGKGWWLRFMNRRPDLRLRKGDDLAQVRANAVTAENFQHYYKLLEETLKKHGLFNCPSRIYNMDETGLPLDHKPSKVITLKGTKKYIVVHPRTKHR